MLSLNRTIADILRNVKRLTQRSFFVSFSAGIFKPCFVCSLVFLKFLIEALFWKKVLVSYFLTG